MTLTNNILKMKWFTSVEQQMAWTEKHFPGCYTDDNEICDPTRDEDQTVAVINSVGTLGVHVTPRNSDEDFVYLF